MGQALYRKHRSRGFDEVVGQKHITDTLKRAIEKGAISHAYLFTGPRGVGKTSVARILAHEVNNLPYSDESVHLDIIEIDAASNRRIDEIRDLRDKVHISPTSAKYKVYIIDEVHMLTREAFNALLKTLEEPPAHCIFILATTESHKLPETIVSRTQRFEFKPIEIKDAVDHLTKLSKTEGIKISPEAIQLLAEHGRGSFRDSISLLDQVSSLASDKIESADIENFLGLPQFTTIQSIIDAVKSSDSQKLLNQIESLRLGGNNADLVVSQLAKLIREEMLKKPTKDDIKLLKELSSLNGGDSSYSMLELILLDATLDNPKQSTASTPAVSLEKQRPKAPEVKPEEPKLDKKETPAVKATTTPTVATSFKEFNDQAWNEVISRVKSEAASIYTALRLATPKLEGEKLILNFKFPLHKKKIDLTQNKDLISKIVSEVTGIKTIIEAAVDASIPPKVAADPVVSSTDKAPINNISNIFGGAEMLES